MPIISFAKKHRAPLSVGHGTNLMRGLLAADVPVASSCGGDGVCGKCRLQITRGQENLSQPNDTEKFLSEKFHLKREQRISCQVLILGDVEVDATYW